MTDFSRGVFIGAVSMLFVGSMFGATIGDTPDSAFAACAIGQDISLRDTAGTATFEVQFRDGKFSAKACTSNPQADTKN